MQIKFLKSLNNVPFWLKTLFGFSLSWLILTVIVQMQHGTMSKVIGLSSATQSALIVYDPDPIYNLDEQVCASFAKGLAEGNWHVHVQTVKAALKSPKSDYDLYVFCANTYNFAPDDAIADYVRSLDNVQGKAAAAITLGSGTTARAQRVFEDLIENQGAQLVDSKAYWLMRPNDGSRMEEDNVDVAVDMAFKFGEEIGGKVGL